MYVTSHLFSGLLFRTVKTNRQETQCSPRVISIDSAFVSGGNDYVAEKDDDGYSVNFAGEFH